MITSYKTIADKIAEIVTKKLVTTSEFLSPINFPKNPDIIEANNEAWSIFTQCPRSKT